MKVNYHDSFKGVKVFVILYVSVTDLSRSQLFITPMFLTPLSYISHATSGYFYVSFIMQLHNNVTYKAVAGKRRRNKRDDSYYTAVQELQQRNGVYCWVC
jgi:hypothetical protein